MSAITVHNSASAVDVAPRWSRRRVTLVVLPIVLLACVIISVGSGSVAISPWQVVSIFGSWAGLPPLAEFTELQASVLAAIRLPRVCLSVLVGAALATAGAAIQGLFRNPLADPALLGISSGAAVCAAATIVFGVAGAGAFTLPVAAFIGGSLATVAVYLCAQDRGRVNVTTMLLAGIAINALCGAGTGLFTYLADDDELRAITFWLLGSLGGATWADVLTCAPAAMVCILTLPMLARALNALLLGEADARHLGVHVELVKWMTVALVALGVGAAVAVSGMIGFVGLVTPHLVRLWLGPNHLALLPASAWLGATLLVLADLIARTAAAPTELPIGIVTALVGAPFFLYLIIRQRKANPA